MSKAVMISVHPGWCSLIATGKKTLEVRKTCPKIPTPFKCYIYATKAHPHWYDFGRKMNLDGKVIGEFVCDSILPFDVPYPAFRDEMDKNILQESCVTYGALHRYAWHDCLFGWHISDLTIYEEPKTLSDFRRPCNHKNDCCTCQRWTRDKLDCRSILTRPPQSWCYVEEIE